MPLQSVYDNGLKPNKSQLLKFHFLRGGHLKFLCTKVTEKKVKNRPILAIVTLTSSILDCKLSDGVFTKYNSYDKSELEAYMCYQ